MANSKNKMVQIYSELVNRVNLFKKLGSQYAGNRDIYQALGYQDKLTFTDYKRRYLRQDIAKAVIDRPVRAAWRGSMTIESKENDNLLAAWEDLELKYDITTKLRRLDKLSGIGRYGVLLLGLTDVTKTSGMKQPVKAKNVKLAYLKPLAEGSATVSKWEQDPSNERFGKPLLYNVVISNDESSSKTLEVHWTRVVHVVQDVFEDETYGRPQLEAIYNRLMDLEKIVGGDAEMFWRGARPGYHAKVDKEFEMGADEEAGLQDQLDEFEHNMRRFLLNEGVDIKALEQQITDPKSHVAIQIQMIAAEKGIPNRILTGSERGELSSAQDKNEWNLWVQSRREDYMEPNLIRPVVNRFMALGILPKIEKYDIVWDELFAMSPKEKSEIAEKLAISIRYYTSDITGQYILPPDAFLSKILGFTEDEIGVIQAQRELMEELPVAEEEVEIIDDETEINDD
jgi:hypothetical protein